ncbi:MAG: tRNA (guanosine(37)-N1)-methyltransferase TrmD [Firmicutes bacterium]|nr:tRNA (guanosine(37)-N1)-methyltransferase TrmD [Bacillota bacterium]
MRYYVLTLFPDMIQEAMHHSILGRAQEDGKIELETVNIRDFSHNKQLHVDDAPYGGGAGMVMQAPPVYEAWESVVSRIGHKVPVVFMTPAGKVFNQQKAKELSEYPELIFLCGHYEGIDQRVIDEIVTEEISIGDYVLTGGELPALVVMDAVSRMVPGVLGNETSAIDESFSGMYLEYPQYTRPPEFHGQAVPEVLLSGHHENIRKWRLEQSMRITEAKRPELLHPELMSKEELKLYRKLQQEKEEANKKEM